MSTKIKKTVMASLLAALCCIATMIIKVPSPLNGYLNLGDCVVLLCGWMLSPLYGFLAAGMGSALADLFSGYVAYAPATFVIKGLMALTAYYIFKIMMKRTGVVPSRVIGGVIAEILMVGGYFVFEGFMYGFVPSAVNIPANGVQGVAGLVLGVLLAGILEKSGISAGQDRKSEKK